jgi:hypothetical protein
MPVPAVPAETGLEPLERETIPRVARRLLPLLMLGYFCAYLDRVNVGFGPAKSVSPRRTELRTIRPLLLALSAIKR